MECEFFNLQSAHSTFQWIFVIKKQSIINHNISDEFAQESKSADT